jgi:hypothetical protein
MVRCRALTGDRCGEGAVWDDADRALYWCDINRFLVHRFDEESASVKSWVFDEPVVAVALTQTPGQLLLAQASRLTQWWPASDMRRDVGFHLDDYPIARLNDGRPDRQGNFWVGSMQNNVKSDGDLDHAVEGHWTLPGHGKLFRITRGGAHAVYRTEVGISNTVLLEPRWPHLLLRRQPEERDQFVRLRSRDQLGRRRAALLCRISSKRPGRLRRRLAGVSLELSFWRWLYRARRPGRKARPDC